MARGHCGRCLWDADIRCLFESLLSLPLAGPGVWGGGIGGIGRDPAGSGAPPAASRRGLGPQPRRRRAGASPPPTALPYSLRARTPVVPSVVLAAPPWRPGAGISSRARRPLLCHLWFLNGVAWGIFVVVFLQLLTHSRSSPLTGQVICKCIPRSAGWLFAPGSVFCSIVCLLFLLLLPLLLVPCLHIFVKSSFPPVFPSKNFVVSVYGHAALNTTDPV